MDAPGRPIAERRGAPRYGEARHGIAVGRIRPGLVVRVLNASSRGVCLETSHRLLPGTHVDLYLERGRVVAARRARVVRCTVVALAQDRLCYQASLHVLDPIEWFLDLSTRENEVPDSASPHCPNRWVSDSRLVPPPSRVQERPDKDP